MKIRKVNQSAGLVATVVDNLESTTTTNALSSNQGRILNEKINSINDNLTYINEAKENIWTSIWER